MASVASMNRRDHIDSATELSNSDGVLHDAGSGIPSDRVCLQNPSAPPLPDIACHQISIAITRRLFLVEDPDAASNEYKRHLGLAPWQASSASVTVCTSQLSSEPAQEDDDHENVDADRFQDCRARQSPHSAIQLRFRVVGMTDPLRRMENLQG